MAVSIKNLTINTKVNKAGAETENAQKKQAKALSKMDMEAIIQECMDRVKTMIEYELKP